MSNVLPRRAVAFALAVLAAGGLAACVQQQGPPPGDGATTSKSGVATVVVRNDNASDVDVYVVQTGGVRFRLGTVTTAGTGTFTIDPSYFPNGQLGLLATPSTGTGVARPAPITVFGSRVIIFTIAPDIRTSYATVR